MVWDRTQGDLKLNRTAGTVLGDPQQRRQHSRRAEGSSPRDAVQLSTPCKHLFSTTWWDQNQRVKGLDLATGAFKGLQVGRC